MLSNALLNQQEQVLLKEWFQGILQSKIIQTLQRSHISISFKKGSPSENFIVSGIVSESSSHTCKISSKQKVFTSRCSCNEWNQEDHCVHTGALLLRFSQISQKEDQSFEKNQKLNHVEQRGMNGLGVHTKHYGRYVDGAHTLNGARPNSTYSSLQYLLINNKIINFPLSKKLESKLIINLVPASDLEDFQSWDNSKFTYYPIFSYVDPEDPNKIYEKISLFESLYLFNWMNGDCYSFNSDVQNLVKQIKIGGLLKTINQYLKILTPFFDSQWVQIQLNDQSIKDIPFEKVRSRFSIFQSNRKSFLTLQFEIFNDKNLLLSPPDVLKVFTSHQGYLEGFRTKKDAYNFIEFLVDSLEYDNQEFKKHVYSCSKRDELLSWLDSLLHKDEIFFKDPDVQEINYFETKDVLQIFLWLFKSFSSMASRFSYYDKDSKNIRFELPKNQLLGGIAIFYDKMKDLDIEIFYNNNQIKSWSSNIKFEREGSKQNWFELGMYIDKEDLEVIQKAKIGENFLISQNNLIMLDQENKDLLKFMQKYTKFEAKNSESLEDQSLQKFTLSFNRARIFELFELKRYGLHGALTEEEEALCQKLLNLDEMPIYEIKDHYKELARDYQLTGYNWLRFLFEHRFGACLADDMGLGKTLQTIMFISSVLEQTERILIVCPVSIIINWQKEIEKFGNFDVSVYYGSDRQYDKSAKVILTSYGVMKKEAFTNFADSHFDILVMDEVQHLKNIRSQGANAARHIKADFRVCLTGTPVENDLSEFYNIMDLSIPGVWGEKSFLKTTSTKKSRLIAKRTVRPFILRRTKDQVLTELPEKVENHVFLNFSKEEREHYLTSLVSVKQRIDGIQKGRKYGEVLKSLLTLRQLCLWQNKAHIMSTKIDYLCENLEQLIEEGHKVLVFSQFTSYLDLIENRVRVNSWKYTRIDGSQSFKKRAEQVEEFQNGDANIFLISLKAGGVGLNLTAANYIFIMDPWWNPAVENQAIDRAHRIGQENKVTVYRPIIKDSIEEKVIALQESKRELFKDLMGDKDDEYFSGKLTMKDFEQLLN
jgi:SNF2 family DNA or RNA helicase